MINKYSIWQSLTEERKNCQHEAAIIRRNARVTYEGELLTAWFTEQGERVEVYFVDFYGATPVFRVEGLLMAYNLKKMIPYQFFYQVETDYENKPFNAIVWPYQNTSDCHSLADMGAWHVTPLTVKEAIAQWNENNNAQF